MKKSEVAKRLKAGLKAVEEWQEEHGRFTEDELAEARRKVEEELRASPVPRIQTKRATS